VLLDVTLALKERIWSAAPLEATWDRGEPRGRRVGAGDGPALDARDDVQVGVVVAGAGRRAQGASGCLQGEDQAQALVDLYQRSAGKRSGALRQQTTVERQDLGHVGHGFSRQARLVVGQ